MRQPVPTIDSAEVARLVTREFGRLDATAHDLLAPLASTHPGAVARVSAAALYLAGGDLDRLREWVGVATVDWRDVIAAAEYPRYMQLAVDADADAKQAAIRADAAAYDEWLNA